MQEVEAKKTLRAAAADLLRKEGPTHYQKLAKQVLERDMASSTSKNPASVFVVKRSAGGI